MSDLLESNAILKLDTGEKDGIRRIPVRRLWDASARAVSYDKLVSCAVKYAFGSSRPDLYDVAVSYRDDGDMILVSTDEELAEAFALAGGTPPTLRAFATMAKKEGVEETSEEEAVAVEAKKDEAVAVEEKEKTEAPKTADATEHTAEDTAAGLETGSTLPSETRSTLPEFRTDGAPKLNALPEALVSILAGAVMALQRRANAGSSFATPDAETNSRSMDVEAFFAAGGGKDELKSCISEVTEDAGVNEKTEAESVAETKADSVKDAAEEESPVTSPAAAPTEGQKEETEETPQGQKEETEETPKEEEKKEKPTRSRGIPTGLDPFFIHGRHTCDGCLCTPIIGIRYHAINLPDYDLCQNCIHNYKGVDIQFEPMELDRDRSLQHRWARKELRRARQARYSAGGRRGRPGRHMRPHEAFRELDVQLKDVLGGGAMDFNLFSVPDRPQTKQADETQVESESVVTQVESESVASKVSESESVSKSESVSLKVPEASHSQIHAECAEVRADEEGEKQSEVVTDEAPMCDDNAKVDPSPAASETEGTPRSMRTRETQSSFADDAEDSGTIAREIGVALDRYAEAISDIVDEVDQRVGQGKKESDHTTPTNLGDDSIGTICDTLLEPDISFDLDSVEALVGFVSNDVAQVNMLDGDVEEEQEEPRISDATFFVARATKDVAQENMFVVDVEEEQEEPRILEEASVQVTTNDVTQEDVFVVDVEEEQEAEAEAKATASASAAGVTIVEPVEIPNGGEGTNEDTEWHILQDEMIANAAQVLGSALFQSDMSHSAEGLSPPPPAPTRASAGSSVTSSSVSSFARVSRAVSDVGSDVSSVVEISSQVSSPVSVALLARWDKELKQLRELGFLDDRRSIDALEHLEAARVGVDSEEEDAISMDDVVNFLLTNTVH